jgi:ATP-dependent 26S proteasome regulatory subunit
MSFITELNLLLKARYSLIYVPTCEEDRLEYTIRQCVLLGKNRAIYSWNFVDGFLNTPNTNELGKRNPLQALDFIEKLSEDTPVIFLLKDFHKFFNDITVLRKVRNLGRLLQVQPKTIIISAPEIIPFPPEIVELVTILEFELPTIDEIQEELKRLLNVLDQSINSEDLNTLVRACQGLSLDRIRRVLSKIIADNEIIDSRGISSIFEEKKQIINQNKILEFCSSDQKLENIGGLAVLKKWLKQRSCSLSDQAKDYGLPVPRGLLLVGIQGTGKSLTAKAIGNDWKLPLLRLDFGRLFGGIVGESEFRTREMIRIVEALAPCILWIDEIDKSFQQSESKGDSGTTGRVLATFITWLSEKRSQVFVVATANNFQVLPLELIRKGRFDEIFFVDLPNENERTQIFTVLLSQLRPGKIEKFDLVVLSKESRGFSGAEISQAIIEAMFFAFNEDREFTTADILLGITNIIPLAQLERQKIKVLQEWAESGRIRTAS